MTGGVVTVPGADGHSIQVTVNGSMAFNLAQQYAAVLNGVASSGTLYVSTVDATPPGYNPHVSRPTNEFIATSGGVYTYADGYDHFTTETTDHVVINPTSSYTGAVRNTLVGTGGATFEAGNETGTFIAGGGNNIFTDFGGGGGYTVVTSDGDDKIFVSNYGFYNIDAGTGNNLLMLGKNDDIITSEGTDQIFMSTGADTISVLGTNTHIYGSSGNLFLDDTQGKGTVLESESGSASIIGGTNSSYQVQGMSTVLAGASDTISAAGNTTVFGGTGTHVFDSGSGSLLFISQTGSTSTVNSGSASATVFGSLGSSITYAGKGMVTTQGGDETINGAGSTMGFTGTIAGQAGGGHTHLMGGSGNDTLVAGQGSQTISGGTGKNMFDISANNTESNASITISDFGKSTGNLVNLFGYGAHEIAAALKTAVTHAGNTTITLADSTQVTFTSVTHLNSSMFTG